MKLRTIVSDDFAESLRQIMALPVPATASYKLADVGKIFTEQNKLYNDARNASLKKFAALQENGEIKTSEGNIVEFKDDESKLLFLKETDELGEQDIVLPSIKLASLGDVKIEPRALLFLREIIVE